MHRISARHTHIPLRALGLVALPTPLEGRAAPAPALDGRLGRDAASRPLLARRHLRHGCEFARADFASLVCANDLKAFARSN